MYWSHFVIVLTLIFTFIALVGISIVSFFQTERAFQGFNDPTIVVLGFSIGDYISILFAMAAQYTQNVALYIKKYFCSDKVIFRSEIPLLGEIEIFDTSLADTAFWVSAVIDSLTNVVWFYQSVIPPSDAILKVLINVIGYGAMFAVVFAEEAIGVVLDALKNSIRQLKDIRASEKRFAAREKKEEKLPEKEAQNTRTSPPTPQPRTESRYR
jgi:hypothetical protein